MSDTITKRLELLIEANAQKFNQEIASMTKRMDGLEKKSHSTSKSIGAGFKSALPDMSKFALAAGAATIALNLLSSAFDMVLAKEDQLADLSAITGITGKELVALGDSATELSNKFGTSVVENIEAFKGVVSRLGPSFGASADAMRIMAEDINVLSKASGLTATQAMDALTTAMLQYGVSLDNPVEAANKATEMMNIMAAGAKEGAAEIPQLAASLEQVGSTAKSLNIDFDETVAALEILATKGKYGSEAGVGLRNVLVSLSKPSKDAAEKLVSMGLSAEEFNKILVEKGVAVAFGMLNEKIQALPDLAERASTKVLLFGKENLSAADAVMSGAEAIEEMTGKLNDTNTAFDQSNIKMATTSEVIKRTSTEFMNDFAGGLETVATELGGVITNIVYGIDQFASAMGNLLELDLEGFWNDLTSSGADYRAEQEKILAVEEQRYQLAIKQANKDIERTTKSAQRAELSKQLNDTLLKAADSELDKYTQLSTVTEGYLSKTGKGFADLSNDLKRGLIIQEFEKQFNSGGVKTIDEFFLSFSKAQDTADVNDKAVKDDAEKRRQKELKDEAAYQAARIANITDVIQKLDAQYQEDLRLIDVSDDEKRTKDEKRIAAQRKYNIEYADVILANISNKAIGDMNRYQQQLMDSITIDQEVVDQNESLFDNLGKQLDEYANRTALASTLISSSFGGIGDALGSAITGQDSDGFKDTLKSILISLLDFVEAEWVAAQAAATIRAFATFGVSALADTWGWVAAFAALELAKGVVGSFDVGAWRVPQTQLAMIHQDEMILPPPMAESIRRGDAVLSNGSKRRKKQNFLKGAIDINVTDFGRGNKYSVFSTDIGTA